MAVFAIGKAVANEIDTFDFHPGVAVASLDSDEDFDAEQASPMHGAKVDHAEEFHLPEILVAFDGNPQRVLRRVTDVTMDGAALCRRERPPRA